MARQASIPKRLYVKNGNVITRLTINIYLKDKKVTKSNKCSPKRPFPQAVIALIV